MNAVTTAVTNAASPADTPAAASGTPGAAESRLPAGAPAPSCHQPVIELDGVSFAYEGRPVIQDLRLSVKERDFALLAGSNGAGKTTLLRMIVGLLKPERGEVRLFGEPAAKFKRWERIGYVPQKNSFNPLFPATVREVVLSGLYGRRRLFGRVTRADLSKCDDAMQAMQIENLADSRIGMLSGGQQQRVFLARALINNPDLLILDEPTVGIDAETQNSFYHMITHMHRHHNITFLMVTHDMERFRTYVDGEPAQEAGKLRIYVRHSHDREDCVESDLTHTLKDLRQRMSESANIR